MPLGLGGVERLGKPKRGELERETWAVLDSVPPSWWLLEALRGTVRAVLW